MGLTLIATPGVEPVTLAEAKLHLRVDAADDDTLIAALIVAARNQAESRTGRALVTQQWRLDLDRFPVDTIDLPLPPLQSVESVTYLDAYGVRQNLAESEYTVIANETPGSVIPDYGKTWPGCRVTPGSVQISFTAGYGLAAAVPQDIKQWMLVQISQWYENRDAEQKAELGFVDGLLDPYRILRF